MRYLSITLNAAAGLTALLLCTPTQASTIYDNLPASSSGTDPVRTFGPLYDSFTSPATPETISSLDLALSGPGGTGTLTIGLYSDSATHPGALIATLGSIADPTITAGVNTYSVSLINNPSLTPGTRYWIGLVDDADSGWAWAIDTSGTGVAGEYFANSNGTFPNSSGPYQMRLLGSSTVPDAGSASALLGLGVAALAAARRRS